MLGVVILNVGMLSVVAPGVSLELAPALLTNITLGQKSFPGTNTQAYYEHCQSTDVKSFITFGLGRFLYVCGCIIRQWSSC